jgi:hypothetical protein
VSAGGLEPPTLCLKGTKSAEYPLFLAHNRNITQSILAKFAYFQLDIPALFPAVNYSNTFVKSAQLVG